MGTFVVTTDFKSAKEVIYDNADGVIVRESDIADTLERLIKRGHRNPKQDSMNSRDEFLNLNNIKQFENLVDFEGSNEKD